MKLAGVVLSALLAALPATMATAQQSATQVGILTCEVEGGFGLIIGSKKEMVCGFRHEDGRREAYAGSIGRLGIDIGATKHSVIKWAVFAPSKVMDRGALAGGYSGASGEVSFIAGLGANVLLGGLDNSFALQPLSVQAQIGFDIAAGVAHMKLRSIP